MASHVVSRRHHCSQVELLKFVLVLAIFWDSFLPRGHAMAHPTSVIPWGIDDFKWTAWSLSFAYFSRTCREIRLWAHVVLHEYTKGRSVRWRLTFKFTRCLFGRLSLVSYMDSMLLYCYCSTLPVYESSFSLIGSTAWIYISEIRALDTTWTISTNCSLDLMFGTYPNMYLTAPLFENLRLRNLKTDADSWISWRNDITREYRYHTESNLIINLVVGAVGPFESGRK